MKNKVLFCALTAMAALTMQSCMIRIGNFGAHEGVLVGSGNITEINVDGLTDFDEISVSLPMDVEYVYGEPSVVIRCDDNAAKYISAKCEGKELKLEMAPEKATLTRCHFTARVSSTSLKSVSLAGSGEFSAAGLDEKTFFASVAGSGDIELDGINAESVKLSIAVSGEMDAKDIRADSVKMSIAGSGDVRLDRIDARSLSGSIAGSGDITVNGRADKATFDIAGSGEVHCDGLDCPKLEVRK